MELLDKDEAWTIYNEFFDAADSAIDASPKASKHIDEFNNLYGLLIDIALECEQQISSDDEIHLKVSYLTQASRMYTDISPEELRLWYAEGNCYKKSDNRLVELTVEQTQFIALMGMIIYENAFNQLKDENGRFTDNKGLE